MGEKLDKKDFIDCMSAAHIEEAGDAYVRYANIRKSKSERVENVYMPKHT